MPSYLNSTSINPLSPDPAGNYNFGTVNELGQVTAPHDVSAVTGSPTLPSGSTLPPSGSEGQMFVLTTTSPFSLHFYTAGDWHLLAAPTITNVALNATATADSINGAGNEAFNANNGDAANVGVQWISANSAPPHWIEFDLLATTRIVQWQAYFQPGQWPAQAFVLQRWDTGTSAWVDVDPVTGNSAAAVSRNITPFDAQKVRLYVTVPTQPGTGDNRVRLIELEIYGYSQGA